MNLPLRTARTRLTAALAAALLVTPGCAASDGRGSQGQPSRTHHADGRGVLSVGSGGGGGLALKPSRRAGQKWSATFGVFVLCTRDGVPATLEKVTWRGKGAGAAVTPYLRLVPPAGQRDTGYDYAPAVVRGTPHGANPPLGGDLVADLAGRKVTADCAHPARPDQARQDLVLVVTAGRAGAEVSRFSVDYSAAGRRYALDVNYDLVMCGTEINDPSC